MSWRLLRAVMFVAAAGAVLVFVDGARPRAVLDAGHSVHAARFDGCGESVEGSRPAPAGCRVRVRGLGAWAPARIEIRLAGDVPFGLKLRVGGHDAAWRTLDREAVVLDGPVDERGRIDLEFVAPVAVHLKGVRATQVGFVTPPARRLGLYALALALGAGWLALFARGAAPGAAGAALVLAIGLALDRSAAVLVLPSLLLAAGFGLACGFVVQRWNGTPGCARFVALAALVRLGLVVQPQFPCIDVGFHARTLDEFMAGARVQSRAPNPDKHAQALPVPYPPGFYALLSPVARLGLAPGPVLVRTALGLVESSAPLLVLAVARAGGFTPQAAGAAAAVAAVMPEGLLVLGKGLAANTLAAWVGLAALWAALKRRPGALVVLAALAFLSHFGHTLLLGALLVTWIVSAHRRGRLDTRASTRLALALGGGVLVAWLAYYREAVDLLLAAGAGLHGSAAPFFAVHFVQIGKALQNLLLKFGGITLVPAYVGLRRFAVADALDGLLVPWLAVGAGAAVLAFATPVPLRFEYFLTPAVALLAGLGLDVWRTQGHARRVHLVLAGLFGLHACVGLLLLLGRFHLISVILESNRWPFPVRL